MDIKRKHTIYRHTPGLQITRKAITTDWSTLTIDALIQPMTTSEISHTMPGASKGYAVYTDARLFTADPVCNTCSDIITINGERYTILSSEPYKHNNKILYKGIAIK